MPALFSATLDFGTTPIDEASVTVGSLTGIATNSRVEAWAMRQSTADNSAESHDMLAFFAKFSCGDIVANTSVVVRAQLSGALAKGQFQLEGGWS